MEAELGFAQQLCELHPSEAGGWRPLIEGGRARLAAILSDGRIDAIPAAVSTIEETLKPIAKVGKSYVVHCIGYAHIDMNWMWSWPETVAVAVDTFAWRLG